jgi:hypothetical protein
VITRSSASGEFRHVATRESCDVQLGKTAFKLQTKSIEFLNGSIWRIENSQLSLCAPAGLLTEHKRGTAFSSLRVLWANRRSRFLETIVPDRRESACVTENCSCQACGGRGPEQPLRPQKSRVYTEYCFNGFNPLLIPTGATRQDPRDLLITRQFSDRK